MLFILGTLPKSVWRIFLLALLLRFGMLWSNLSTGTHLVYDSELFLTLASNLRHGVFSLFHPLDIPETARLPLYPLLIHAIGVKAVLLLQVVLSSTKVILVFLIAQHIGLKRSAAMLGALLLAVEPLDVILSATLLTESLFTFLILLGVFCMTRQNAQVSALQVAIVFAGLAWLRPNGALLIPWVAVLALVLLKWPRKRVALFASLSIALVLPWTIWDHHQTGSFLPGSGGLIASAYFLLPSVLDDAVEGTGEQYRIDLRERALDTDWENVRQVRDFHHSLAADIKKTATQHPFLWLKRHLLTSIRVAAAPGRSYFKRALREFNAVATLGLFLSCCFTFLIASSGSYMLFQWRNVPPGSRFILALAAFLILTAGVSAVDARFKAPAMPLFILVMAWMFDRAHAHWWTGSS